MANTSAPFAYLDAVSASSTGAPIELWRCPAQTVSAQLVWTGTVSGTVTVEGSNDPVASRHPSQANWTDVTSLMTVTNPSGSAGNSMINFTFAGWAFVRFVYTLSSGAGNMSVYVHIVRN